MPTSYIFIVKREIGWMVGGEREREKKIHNENLPLNV